MKLKSCPFCGGEARYQKITDTMGDLVFVGYIVKCTKCFAAPLPNNYTGDKKKAAERWNRREPIDRIVEQLEEQKDKHEKLGIEASKLCIFERLEARPRVFDEKMCYEKAVEVLDKAIEIVKGGAE